MRVYLDAVFMRLVDDGHVLLGSQADPDLDDVGTTFYQFARFLCGVPW